MTGTRPKAVQESKLRRLPPFLDDTGLLRVRGQLHHSGLTYDAKHPVLPPKDREVTKLFIRHIYKEGGHEMGTDHTISEIRQRVWIIGVRRHVMKCIWQCSECVKRRRQPRDQLMAPKTASELNGPYRAFLRCAVDFAGPFETRQVKGKVRTKR